MAEEDIYDIPPIVFNTGIVGVSSNVMKQLDYFGDMDEVINTMTELKNDPDSMYLGNIQKSFGYDNETLFSVKLNEHNVPVQWLDNQWHYFFDRQGFIPRDVKFVHAINKDFDCCWRRYYA